MEPAISLLRHRSRKSVEMEFGTETCLDLSSDNANVVLRGPRIKVGLDVGMTSSEISPCTGRMIYRGRVMNRASRIASKASSGSCWSSSLVWSEAEVKQSKYVQPCSDQFQVKGQYLGSLDLKGISEKVAIYQCGIKTKGNQRSGSTGLSTEI